MLQPSNSFLEQQKLSEAISFLQEKLSQLKHESNLQVPIARLPPEILSEVFLNHAAKVRQERLTTTPRADNDHDGLVHKSFYSWLNVSHVSRHWREVSLGCIQLWTWLAFEPRVTDEAIETLLPRAGDLPLTIVLSFFNSRSYCNGCMRLERLCDRYSATLRRLQTLLPRLRELVLVVDWEACEDLWDVLSIPAEFLEAVRIEAVGASRFDPHLAIPSQLFGSQTPRLRSLKLASIGVDWPNTLLCSSLRHLDVTRCEMDGNSELHPFLSALCMLPNLETLRASWSCSSTEAPNAPQAQPIPHEGEIATFPHLKHVYLSAENQRIAAILLRTRWPFETRMHFKVLDHVEPAERERFQLAIRALLSKETVRGAIYTLGGWGVDNGLLLWSVEGMLTGDPPPTEHENAFFDGSKIPPPRLHIQTPDEFTDPIRESLQAIDLSYLRMLFVFGAKTGRQWASMFQPAKRLVALRVKGATAFGLPALLAEGARVLDPRDVELSIRAGLDEWHWLEFNKTNDDLGAASSLEDAQTYEDMVLNAQAADALNDAMAVGPSAVPADSEARANEDDGTPDVLFPALHAVQIAGVDMAPPEGWTGSYPYKYATVMDLLTYQAKHAKYGLDVAALARCLRMRRERGVEDLGLEFRGCHCQDKAQLQPLAELGVDVRWDGVVVLSATP